MPTAFLERLTRPLLADREPRLIAACREVAAWRRQSRPQWQADQLVALRALVEEACEQLPFYRDKYRAAGFRPSDLRSWADLERIPLLTKHELREAGPQRLAPRAGDGVRLLSSSGSTGVSLRIYRNEASLWTFMASTMAQYLEWCEGQPIADVLYCVDLATDSIDFAMADLLRTIAPEQRILPVTLPATDLLAQLDDLRPRFISTYPSTLRAVAVELHRRGRTLDRLRLAHLTSETCDQRTRQLLAEVFPRARVVETYTSTEAGLIAFQCHVSGTWHVAEQGLIAEIVDDDGRPTRGLGRLVLTDLTNRATPIVRYAGLGDLCQWHDAACACGTELRSLARLAGRVAELIVLPDGTAISPYVVTNALEELPGIYQFQVVQHAATAFEVLIVRERGSASDADVRATVADRLRAALGIELTCEARVVEQILPRPGAHKVPLVVSHVPRPR